MRSCLSLVVLLLALPSPTHAQDAAAPTEASSTAAPTDGTAALRRAGTMFTPSLLVSYGGGRTADFAVGANLRLAVYPTPLPLRLGGFVSGEVTTGGTVRVAGGLEGGLWLFDCQIGLAYRSATAQSMGSLGLQLGKTIDFGWISVGGRVTIPLIDFAEPNGGPLAQGVEGALVITVGWPNAIDGEARSPLDCPRAALRQMRDRCPCHHDDDQTADAPAASP